MHSEPGALARTQQFVANMGAAKEATSILSPLSWTLHLPAIDASRLGQGTFDPPQGSIHVRLSPPLPVHYIHSDVLTNTARKGLLR